MDKIRKLPSRMTNGKNAQPSHDPAAKAVVSRESRTMVLARAAATVTATAVGPAISGTLPKIPTTVKPVTPAEQYWAARALTAEALLSVKTTHQEEIRTLALAEETKRMVSRPIYA